MSRRNLLCSLILLYLLSGAARAEADIKYVEPSDVTGTSMAVVVGPAHLAHTAQLLPLDKDGRIVGKGEAAEQAAQVLDNLAAVLREVESGLHKVFTRRFRGKAKPAVSFVVGKLAHPDALVSMDAVAVTERDPRGEVKRVRCAALAGAMGGSHVAVLPKGGKVYVAGQAEKGDLAEATRKTLESLRATLKHLELNDAHVVQLKAFLRPMSAVGEVEKEMAKFFGKQTVPPLVFVEWDSTLPIEIELIAAGGKDKAKEAIEYLTPPGMSASPIYSRVARVHHEQTIYLAGLYGTKAKAADEQIEEIFATLKGLLEKTGSDFRHLVKATYYVSNDDASRKLNELRPRYYDPKRPPAASKALVAGVGVEGKSITLDMIAVPAK
jgi:enamine deaminase RidA (YjgF/YER057c/UK114 family)